jgi:outer membrane lipase/esterase
MSQGAASMKLKSAFWVGAALLWSTQLAEAQHINQLVGFGDSATDTGSFAHTSTGIPLVDFWIASSLAAGGNAHFTGPGTNNTQILGGFFGLSANPANTPGGTNFAIGGAVDFLVPPGFPGTATGNLFPNPLLPGTATQIGNYLTSVGGHANPNALYVLSSGGNDITAAGIFAPFSPAAVAYLLGEARTLSNSVVQLQAAGARYIIMSNYYPGPTTNPLTLFYGNTILSATWSDLAAAGVKFIPADTVSVFTVVEQNLAKFGFTAPVTSFACVPPVGFLGLGWGQTCAPTTTPNPNYGYLVSADALQTHLFMDGVHLTQAGQQIEADYFYNLLVAPSEISYLAEAPVKTRSTVVSSIFEQIAISQRQRAPGSFNTWVTGNISSLSMGNYPGFPTDPGTPGMITVGTDYLWAPNWLVGGAVSAGTTTQSFSLGGNFKQNEFALSGYSAYADGRFWFDVVGTYGGLHYDVNRIVPLGIMTVSNTGNTRGSNASLASEIGYNFQLPLGSAAASAPLPVKAASIGAPLYLVHGPVVGILLQRIWVDGFTETDSLGGVTALSYANQIRNSAVTELGYQAHIDVGIWSPYAKLTWNHELVLYDRSVTASLTTIAAPSYSMPAVAFGKDWGTGTIGTTVALGRGMTAYASFTSQFGQSQTAFYGGRIGLNVALNAPAPPIAAKY